MAEYLPFWPKAAAGAYITDGNDATIYSKALPTNGFTEVVIQFEVDAAFGTSVSTTVTIQPQISNDGINWKTLDAAAGYAELKIAANATFPAQDTEKFTEIAAFMRMKIIIHNGEGGGTNMTMAPTIQLAAAGRN